MDPNIQVIDRTHLYAETWLVCLSKKRETTAEAVVGPVVVISAYSVIF